MDTVKLFAFDKGIEGCGTIEHRGNLNNPPLLKGQHLVTHMLLQVAASIELLQCLALDDLALNQGCKPGNRKLRIHLFQTDGNRIID
jgi:hypothetical protein